MGVNKSYAINEYLDEYSKAATRDSRLNEQLESEQKEKNTEQKEVKKVESFNTPAVEVIFSTGMLKKVRSLYNSAQHVSSKDASSVSMSSSKVSAQCAALSAKLSRNGLTKGERTYIQSEIDFLERNITRMNLAM